MLSAASVSDAAAVAGDETRAEDFENAAASERAS